MIRIKSTFSFEGEFIVTIADNAPVDVFTRAENVEEFQNYLYGDSVKDKQTVLQHWAWNCLMNSVDDASRLDGWGELERGMVTFLVVGSDNPDVDVYRERDWPEVTA